MSIRDLLEHVGIDTSRGVSVDGEMIAEPIKERFMSDEILIGDTPFFDQLAREYAGIGKPFEGMIADGVVDLRPSKESSWVCSPLLQRANEGLAKARIAVTRLGDRPKTAICTEHLQSDLPVVLKEDVELMGAVVEEAKQEAGTPFKTLEKVSWEGITASMDPLRLIHLHILTMFDRIVSEYKFAVVTRINLKRRLEFDSIVLNVELFGLRFDNGIPDRFKSWSIDKMIEPLQIPDMEPAGVVQSLTRKDRYSALAAKNRELRQRMISLFPLSDYIDSSAGLNEPDTFQISKTYDVLADELHVTSNVFTKIVELFHMYTRDSYPNAIATDISAVHVEDLKSNGITYTIRGINCTDGRPEDQKEWTIQQAVSDILFGVEPKLVKRTDSQYRSRHLEKLVEDAAAYLGADGAVKAVRDASVVTQPENPSQGFQVNEIAGIQVPDWAAEKYKRYQESQRDNPLLIKPVVGRYELSKDEVDDNYFNVQNFIQEGRLKFAEEHPLGVLTDIKVEKDSEGVPQIVFEGVEPPKEVIDIIGDDLPDELYMTPKFWDTDEDDR